MTDAETNTDAQASQLIGVEDVGRHLEEAILTGRLRPGAKLESERRLADRLGVGRPMVREALKRLEERNLIAIHPARGSFVREFRASQETRSAAVTVRRAGITARQLNRARQALECESAGLAAENRTAEHVRQMQAILATFDDDLSADERAHLDLSFHEAIVIASGNPALQVMFGSIRTMTSALMLRSLSDRAVTKAGAPIHHAILRAIELGRPAAARRHMQAHLRIAETHYGSDIDEPLADVLWRRAELIPSARSALRDASLRLDDLSAGPPTEPALAGSPGRTRSRT